MSEPYDPASEGAQMSFKERMSYSDYLHLEKVLEAQTPQSSAHDEMLFIIQHQTSELWMKLALHEIGAAIRSIRADRLEPSFKMLSRVARIFEQLNNAWDVLRTMTPSEYTEFRDALGQSSGFQSWQYRAIEFMAGNRNLAMLGPHKHRPDLTGKLEAILAQPSSTMKRCCFWRATGSTSAPMPGARTGGRRAPKMKKSWSPGRPSTATRSATGCSMSWPKSWSISRTISAAGASTMSPRSSASSA